MKTISDLSEDQFKKLLDEYFANPSERTKMTSEEVKEIAERLNKKINVPLISETKEEKILIKIVLKIDRFLYDNLPNEFYDLVRSLDKGINDGEAKRLIVRLSQLANRYINIPYIPEKAEYIAIRFIIGIIINAARKAWNISSSKVEMQKKEIPEEKEISIQQMEALLV